jgi:hypothetical protein
VKKREELCRREKGRLPCLNHINTGRSSKQSICAAVILLQQEPGRSSVVLYQIMRAKNAHLKWFDRERTERADPLSPHTHKALVNGGRGRSSSSFLAQATPSCRWAMAPPQATLHASFLCFLAVSLAEMLRSLHVVEPSFLPDGLHYTEKCSERWGWWLGWGSISDGFTPT